MGNGTADDSEIDGESNKQAKIIQKVENTDTENPTVDEIKDYLAIHAQSEPEKQEEIIELVSQKFDWNKSTVRKMLKKQKEKNVLDDFKMKSITKITPINKDDDTIYQFHIQHIDDEYSFKIRSSELVSPKIFKQKVLELTDRLLTFESWTDQLNEWLQSCEVTVREEEPLRDAHAVTEHIFSQLDMLQFTNSREEFKKFAQNMGLKKEDKGELLVSGKWIDEKVDELNKDVSMRKVRNLLDEYMPEGGSKKVRKSDGYFRAWKFDLEKLRKIGVLEEIQGDN